jgi:hypothetical protein
VTAAAPPLPRYSGGDSSDGPVVAVELTDDVALVTIAFGKLVASAAREKRRQGRWPAGRRDTSIVDGSSPPWRCGLRHRRISSDFARATAVAAGSLLRFLRAQFADQPERHIVFVSWNMMTGSRLTACRS